MLDFINVSKHFGTQDVLRNASFRANKNERVGIVGPNGSGKSTVFSLICGEISPDQGEVVLPKNCRLGYLRQQLNAHELTDVPLIDYTSNAIPELTRLHAEIHVLEQRLAADPSLKEELLPRIGSKQTDFENRGGYRLVPLAEKTLCALGFQPDDLHRPFASFSGGWQMRAELARTLISDPDILLLDEPSNYLDLPAVEWLDGFLRSYQGTLLLISHDRYLLETLTGVTVECSGGLLTRYAGNYAWYQTERENRTRTLEAAKANQDKRREQIERFVERFRAKNTKATQVQSRIKLLDKMENIELPTSLFSNRRIDFPAPPHSGAETARLAHVGLTYDHQRWIFRHLDWSVNRGDKVALIGFNGVGKTTLLRILAQAIPPSEGNATLGHQVVVGYQSQEFAETMPPESTLFTILKEANPSVSDGAVRALLGSFGFPGQAAGKQVRVLSGGEKIRLAFARIFINPPNFLILDEPTTHLDIATREALEKALQEYEGTVCFVSHDVEFVRRSATGILEMTPSGVHYCPGGYDYYQEKRASRPAAAATTPSDRETRVAARREKQEQLKEWKRESLSLKKQVREAETGIERLESEQADLLEQLAGGSAVNYATLNQRLAAIQQELQQYHQSWETAYRKLDEIEQQSTS
ncbi:MAG: ATP-binding cassette domain-containing protein [Kiritimatiellae bacterium]|nr:ATP-binding cassette domain-containing protein [Kiritimatiellia bacterium]